MCDSSRLKTLTFTTLFPNLVMPSHGVFIKNRLEKMIRYCDIDVVAPVNVTRSPSLFWKVPGRETLGDIQVYHPRFGVIPGLLKHWDAELLFKQVSHWIKSNGFPLEQYDLLNVHYAYPDGVAGWMLARKMRKPFAITLHGSDINFLAQFPRRRRLIQEMLQGARVITVVSKALGEKVEALGVDPEKIHCIPNGVTIAVFSPRKKEEARQILGLPEDAYILLSVGRLVQVKGFDLLIRSMLRVRELFKKPVRCYIVGDGELRNSLEREILGLKLEKEVILHGGVPQAELPLWYSAADLFCLLSHSEGCPNVVLESLACGTPVVATTVGGIPEILQEDVTGFFVRDRDEEEVARQIEKGISKEWDRKVLTESDVLWDWADVARVQFNLFKKSVSGL